MILLDAVPDAISPDRIIGLVGGAFGAIATVVAWLARIAVSARERVLVERIETARQQGDEALKRCALISEASAQRDREQLVAIHAQEVRSVERFAALSGLEKLIDSRLGSQDTALARIETALGGKVSRGEFKSVGRDARVDDADPSDLPPMRPRAPSVRRGPGNQP